MNKLQQLTKYLIDATYQGRKLAKPSQFDAWIENCRIEPASKKINNSGILAARFYYSPVISINPCAAPVELISIYISCWLQNNAEKDDSEAAELSSDRLDDNSSEVEITIDQFVENIELIESSNGPFELNGQRYDFGEQSIWVATAFTLDGEIIQGDC